MKEEVEINIDETNITEEDNLLFKLKYVLNYELSSSAFYFLSFGAGMMVLYLSALAALLFTPFLIYVLIKAKKYTWLISFLIVVLLPVLIMLIISSNALYTTSFLLVQLGMFYVYCFVLRFSVIDWVEDIKWKSVRKKHKVDSNQNRKMFQSRYNKSLE
ncbi:MAG: hypothetical protein FD188_136 [Ignavibacteria bacterium]|nr:MAG: hypothetical protein FD188_136 [Ignavibacteria bacterium]